MRRIAVGGMAEVFKAKLLGPKSFEKTLAVKKILPEFNEDEDFIQMFVDEARISSNLHHSNIVQVFDFGEVQGSYYIAMEWVDGPNLRNLLQRHLKTHSRFPKDLAMYICLQIAKALDYAHNVRIDGESSIQLVHRDVSPQNILISRVGEVKITDFGIAKATIKLSKTQPGKVQGKLSYMSPEQATGKAIDRRSDIFSLGIIFIELLTGSKAYVGENTGERFERIREARVPNLKVLVPDLPENLTNLIYTMVAKNPEDRPQSGQEVVEALTRLLASASLARLEQALAELVEIDFPKEQSDSKIDPQINPPMDPPEKSEPNKIADEQFTAISEGRLPLSMSEHSEPKTKPIEIPKTELDISLNRFFLKRMFLKFPIGSYVALGGLFVIAISIFIYMLLHEDNPSNQNIDSAMIQPMATASPQATIASGPVDVDLRVAAEEREKEIQMRLQELEDEVFQAKRDAEKTAKQLEKAQAKLKKLDPNQFSGPCPKNMIHIRRGNFLLGSSPEDPERNDLVETKLQSVTLPGFCIDKYEYPNKKGAVPRIRVTWNDAVDLCAKQGKRLCFQEEWERACKGPDSDNEDRKYVFGNYWRANVCNMQTVVDDLPKDQKILPSGQMKNCTSKEGVFDLTGNVDEWTFSPGTFNPGSHVTKGDQVIGQITKDDVPPFEKFLKAQKNKTLVFDAAETQIKLSHECGFSSIGIL
ncbi:MAG: protein kinase [Bdellovibrionales bacterium]|nr:protein kinase [Bdellovibrionales bacterium]